MNFRKLTDMFIPRHDARHVPTSEGYLIRDLTMPARDWSAYDAPAIQRKGKPRANVAKREIKRLLRQRETPAFLLRQAG